MIHAMKKWCGQMSSKKVMKSNRLSDRGIHEDTIISRGTSSIHAQHDHKP